MRRLVFAAAESVDAHAIEQGGKLGAIDNFNANHEGWFCWAEPGS